MMSTSPTNNQPNTDNPVGNYYDKFNSTNPVAKRLMDGFKSSFLDLLAQVPTTTQTVLEVGCGEGYMLELMSSSSIPKLMGLDVDIPVLVDAHQRVPDAALALADGHYLPYPTHAFDLVVACEVLEHVRSPKQVLGEIHRVGRKYFIASVPREPIWRILNMARGQYLNKLGNTPGHINHWSSSSFLHLLEDHFKVVEIRHPLPWTMVLCVTNS